MLTLTGALLLPCVLSATTYTPLKVLFVANGNYSQETNIQNHLTALGATVTKMKDYQVKSTTNFAAYDLLLITEFAPNIPGTALSKIKTAGVPVLIVEYWDFWYSYKLGLTTTDSCGYVGATTVELLDDATRAGEYAGGTPQVYSTSYTVYGVSEFDLKAGVEAVAWSSTSFGEYAMIIDRARNIAATGVYDTRKYTTEAWILFDETISEIAPLGPAWESDEEALQGYVDSGLWSYIENLTGNETEAAVRSYVWPKIYAYSLHDITATIEVGIQQKLGDSFVMFPGVHLIETPHPAYSDEHGDMLWFLGEHCDRSDGYCEPGDYSTPHYGPPITGADLGISVALGSRTYFYMGDTWGARGTQGCGATNGNGMPECNDGIVRLKTGESDPWDGLEAEVVKDTTATTTSYLPLTINGVHRNFNQEVWGTNANVPFSIPTGASSGTTLSTVHPSVKTLSPVSVSVSYARVWYVTQNTREDDTPKTAKSWVGCTGNGTTLENCYPSFSDAVGDTAYPYFSKLNFLVVSPVEIGADELAAMGANAPTSPSDKGTLLFGTTHPFRCSAMYLAYIDSADFGRADPLTGRPLGVLYFKGILGDMWTDAEELAAPVFEPTSCLEDASDITIREQGLLWERWEDIMGAWVEEKLWALALGDEAPAVATITVENSGCHYGDGSDCDANNCWVDGPMFTGEEKVVSSCTMCSQEEVDACVATYLESNLTFDVYKYPWPPTEGFGDFSVKLVKNENISKFVVLSNHPIPDWSERDAMVAAANIGVRNNPITGELAGSFSRYDFTWNTKGVFLRTAEVSSPWSWSSPVDTGTPGYAPLIIDRFSSIITYGIIDPQQGIHHDLMLWYTISSWHGDVQAHENGLPGEYGVYTTNLTYPL